MRSKLNYLIGVSLGRKIKTKWFVIANILLALGIIAVININSIIEFFGGDFDEKTKVYIVDQTDYSYNFFVQQLDIAESSLSGESTESSYELILSDKSVVELQELIKTEEESGNIILEFNKTEKEPFVVKIITKEYLDYIDTGILTTALNNTKIGIAINNSNIPPEILNSIYSEVSIERIYLEENKNTEDENMSMLMTTVFPIIILPIFMLTLFLVQMVGAEINDEKTTRGMEIIISNVSPKTHFFSKVIASNLFVIMQSILLILYAVIGIGLSKLVGNNIGSGVTLQMQIGAIIDQFMSSSVKDSLIYIIPLTVILTLLTFLAYSVLAGILASMTTNTEDFQQLQTPIMIISLVGYYLAVMAGVFEGATFIKVLSYVPFISSILSPSLLVLGQIGVVDVIISIIITIITNYILIKYGLKIYKVGILNYSSKDLWKKMFKALKN